MADARSTRIEVKANGPYVVFGGAPLRRKRPVTSERGEPLAWWSGPVIDEGAGYALCRCGGSARKPYCDGTHAANAFDGTETAPTDDRAARVRAYDGTGIEVLDDRGICQHAGFCGNQVTNVWKMVRDTGDTSVRTQVIAMIEHCPSGALTYRIDGEAVEPGLAVEIGVVDDGPLWVTGGVTVERSDGQPVETRNRVTLCRCGASNLKPLCDGTHKEIGFRDDGTGNGPGTVTGT
jgi:CDGSH-type Zn-finger protein